MTEIETVTVSFEELKAKVDHYYRLKETKRLLVLRDGKEIAAVGPWLPDERRFWSLQWYELLYELFLDPLKPDDPELSLRVLEATRGYRPFT
jgi:hypothetical protein